MSGGISQKKEFAECGVEMEQVLEVAQHPLKIRELFLKTLDQRKSTDFHGMNE